jgi:hypothetical protein
LAEDNSRVLHDFYRSLKNVDKHLRFIFVTGITRFALTSLDSGGNNLNDISLDSEYAGICGFSEDEFDTLFEDRMEETLIALKKIGHMKPESEQGDLRAKIFSWYDGYNWCGQFRVMNPFSVLNFFHKKKLSDYWFRSGMPSHLPKMMRENPLGFLKPKLDSYTSDDVMKVDFFGVKPVTLLFHSGYLTIDKEILVDDEETGDSQLNYSFRLPNSEVRGAYRRFCYETIFESKPAVFLEHAKDFYAALLERKANILAQKVHDILSGITYFQHISLEKYYHSMVQVALVGMGFEVIGEVAGSIGRSEIVVLLPENDCLIIEVKYRQEIASTDKDDIDKELLKGIKEAKEALIEKDYSGPWRLNAREIVMMALTVYDRDMVMVEFVSGPNTLG